MLQRDRVFLADYVAFGHLNHLVAAYSFFTVAGGPNDAAIAILAKTRGLDRAAAAAEAAQFNEDARVQKIAIARLYGELAAAIEDLGALCDAVRHRSNATGIFRRYLRSDTAAACQVLDHVRDNPTADLSETLKLPSLSELHAILPQETHIVVTTEYRDIAQQLHAAAESYRQKPAEFKPLPVPTTPQPTWQQDVNIVVDVFDQAEAISPPKGGTMAQVYNKIKHRFMVIEDLEGLVQSKDTPGHILAGMLGTEESTATNLLTATQNAVVTGVSLASLLLLLDHHAVKI